VPQRLSSKSLKDEIILLRENIIFIVRKSGATKNKPINKIMPIKDLIFSKL
jgi:hypothetical protein